MGRATVIALLSIAGVVGLFYLMDQWPGAELPIFSTALVVVTIVALLSYLVRHRTAGRINPFEVYLWLVVAFALCVALGSILQLLGPAFLMILTTSLAAAGGFAWWRQSQKKHGDLRAQMGLCSVCGYDLRATDSLCPECGSPLPAEIERMRRIRDELSKTRPFRSRVALETQQTADVNTLMRAEDESMLKTCAGLQGQGDDPGDAEQTSASLIPLDYQSSSPVPELRKTTWGRVTIVLSITICGCTCLHALFMWHQHYQWESSGASFRTGISLLPRAAGATAFALLVCTLTLSTWIVYLRGRRKALALLQ